MSLVSESDILNYTIQKARIASTYPYTAHFSGITRRAMTAGCLSGFRFYNTNPDFVPAHCAILKREREICAICSNGRLRVNVSFGNVGLVDSWWKHRPCRVGANAGWRLRFAHDATGERLDPTCWPQCRFDVCVGNLQNTWNQQWRLYSLTENADRTLRKF